MQRIMTCEAFSLKCVCAFLLLFQSVCARGSRNRQLGPIKDDDVQGPIRRGGADVRVLKHILRNIVHTEIGERVRNREEGLISQDARMSVLEAKLKIGDTSESTSHTVVRWR